MENSYLQPVIRNIFGEIPGNSVVPEISYNYFPGGITSSEEYEFEGDTGDENESIRPVTSETPVEITHDPEKELAEEQYVAETNHSTKSQRAKYFSIEETISDNDESYAQPEKKIRVHKKGEKLIAPPDEETIKKDQTIRKTSFQKIQERPPGEKESENKIPSSQLLPDSSVSLQKPISGEATSTQLLGVSPTFSKKLSQSDDTFILHSEKLISDHIIRKGEVPILEAESTSTIPGIQKKIPESIDLIPPKQDILHFAINQKPQTKLVIGKLTVEVIQPEKEKKSSNPIRERIIVETSPKTNRGAESGLKVKYGLGQL